jgi:RNA polymerase sigma factor (TIGR02999 family)
MNEVTRILTAAEQGDPSAPAKLLPLVYDELRKLASQKLAEEKPGQTLQATALVHEAYIRLVQSPHPEQGAGSQNWNSRGHFFAAAAEAMRRILVEAARRKKANKRSGPGERIQVALDDLPAPGRDDKLLRLDEALARLEEQDPLHAQLVKLRFYAGLTIKDAAAALGISTATADRHWVYARAWLQREMADANP